MEIRFANTQDVGGILELLRQVGLVHHKGRPDIFRGNAQKYSASQVINMLDKPQTPIFIAAEDDKVLGYCFCMIKNFHNDPVMTERTELYIDDLCVDENCRGQGVGKKLYETVCQYAKMRKCGYITLNVWACNESAMKFYEKCGLKVQKIGMETVLEEA